VRWEVAAKVAFAFQLAALEAAWLWVRSLCNRTGPDPTHIACTAAKTIQVERVGQAAEAVVAARGQNGAATDRLEVLALAITRRRVEVRRRGQLLWMAAAICAAAAKCAMYGAPTNSTRMIGRC